MEYGIPEQLLGCLSTFVFGGLAGIIYSFFKFIRMLFGVEPDADRTVCRKRSFGRNAVLFITDLLFSATVAVLYSAVLFAYAYGRDRLVFFACAVFGFTAYHFSAAKLIDPALAFSVRLIGKAAGLCLVPVKKATTFIYSVTVLKIKTKIAFSRSRRGVRDKIKELYKDVGFEI